MVAHVIKVHSADRSPFNISAVDIVSENNGLACISAHRTVSHTFCKRYEFLGSTDLDGISFGCG